MEVTLANVRPLLLALLVVLILVVIYWWGPSFFARCSPQQKIETRTKEIGASIATLCSCSDSNPLKGMTLQELQALWAMYESMRQVYPVEVAAYRLYDTMAILEGDFMKLATVVESVPLLPEDELWRPRALRVLHDLPRQVRLLGVELNVV